MATLSLSLTSGCRAQKPWPLWNSYANQFIDQQGRVIDHGAVDRTTSEGQAYALFFALVSNDRARFDKLAEWTENNLAGGDLTQRLPAWSWGKASDGSWHVLDANSASDADLWMAYTFCEAGRLWHVDRYRTLGKTLANRIAQQEIVLLPSGTTVMLPGSQGFHPSATTWFLNPSYTPPSLLEYFARQNPQGPWAQVLAALPEIVRTSGGFAMDWMAATQDAGIGPSAPPMTVATLTADQKAPTPVGSYDAIRVYLWAGIADPHTPQVSQELASLSGMANFLSAGAVTPPLKVGPEGQVIDSAAPPGFSAAVLPFLLASNRKDAEKVQHDRLTATLDEKSGLYGRSGLYYDQNLALFALGYEESRYRFEANGQLRLKWK
ncbi:cellulose synthase complex periplasmic endoglucanase BcsZ [Granulicella cerasi]|uniref:cellulase n=1 Tax=Granulicella cerasi TaxID=741063 RepID=A0ABW1ZEA3_9BACT|nr:cellulose synthase complex periplasmic endoglucanase BcsZ [Granulicella cerasi]